MSSKGITKFFTHKIYAPVQTSPKSFLTTPPSTLSREIGIGCGLITTSKKIIKKFGTDRIMGKDVAAEKDIGDANDVNDLLAKLVGIEKKVDKLPKGKRKDEKKKSAPESSIFTLENLKPKEVHQKTRFKDLFCLLLYVSTICGSEMDNITSLCTKLTWLEEWMLHFEYIYRCSKTRWQDYESEYKLKEDYCKQIVQSKLSIAIKYQNRWPMYLLYEEDYRFRKEKWNDHFKNKRVKPRSADKQRSLYSEYYAQCCAKGGVAAQLSGWVCTLYLLTSGIVDSAYID